MVVRRLSVGSLLQQERIAGFIGAQTETNNEIRDDSLLERLAPYRGIRRTNGRALGFSSAPDCAVLNTDGSTTAVIAVKDGNDTTSALERFGSVLKAFGNERGKTPDVRTILIVSCLTKEMEAHPQGEGEVIRVFNLTRIVSRAEDRADYLHAINQIIG